MIFLSFSYPHHGEYSSYHRLLAYADQADQVVDASLPGFMYQKVLNPRGWTQTWWRAMKERSAWAMANRQDAEWMHYLYPENGCFRGVELRKGGTKVALTCHLPKDAFLGAGKNRRAFREVLTASDALIVMSPDYVDFYQSMAPRARVEFIPHGIDVHYFRPPEGGREPAGRLQILTVGNMLRDFETLAKVINLAAARGMEWEFKVLALRDRLDGLERSLTAEGRGLARLLCGVSNEELRELYRECHLLYLPLLDATANNAVVEAMASGLPMLLSDFPATRAYAGESAEYLSSRDVDEAFTAISNMATGSGRLRELSAGVRKRAEEQLAWEVIAKRQRSFLCGE